MINLVIGSVLLGYFSDQFMFLPLPIDQLSFVGRNRQASFFFPGGLLKYFICLRQNFTDDNRNVLLDDTCLLKGDLFKTIAEYIHVIPPDVCDHTKFRRNNICTIESSTKTRFYNGDVYFLCRKIFECHCPVSYTHLRATRQAEISYAVF